MYVINLSYYRSHFLTVSGQSQVVQCVLVTDVLCVMMILVFFVHLLEFLLCGTPLDSSCFCTLVTYMIVFLHSDTDGFTTL